MSILCAHDYFIKISLKSFYNNLQFQKRRGVSIQKMLLFLQNYLKLFFCLISNSLLFPPKRETKSIKNLSKYSQNVNLHCVLSASTLTSPPKKLQSLSFRKVVGFFALNM